MEILETVNQIVGWVGLIVGGGSLLTIATLKPKKIAIEIKNLQDVIVSLREENSKLRSQVDSNSAMVTLLWRAVNSAYRCKFTEKIDNCPVVKELEKQCNNNEGVCPIK